MINVFLVSLPSPSPPPVKSAGSISWLFSQWFSYYHLPSFVPFILIEQPEFALFHSLTNAQMNKAPGFLQFSSIFYYSTCPRHEGKTVRPMARVDIEISWVHILTTFFVWMVFNCICYLLILVLCKIIVTFYWCCFFSFILSATNYHSYHRYGSENKNSGIARVPLVEEPENWEGIDRGGDSFGYGWFCFKVSEFGRTRNDRRHEYYFTFDCLDAS